MKQITTFLFTFIYLFSFGQENQTVELKWKIGQDETINYLTEMNIIDSSSAKINFDWLLGENSDSLDFDFKALQKLYSELNKDNGNRDYLITLTHKNDDIVDILMAKNKNEEQNSSEKENDLSDLSQLLSPDVLLRGSVYESGGIHSFWVQTSQKNLIALLFELPSKPIKVGDKWSLDTNLIAFDQNFECENSYKINEVTLTEIKKVRGESIAVLKYNIVEYADGFTDIPAFFGNKGSRKKTVMKSSHQGMAEFSIDKGRWLTYDGMLSVEASGIMTAAYQTKFKLIDADYAGK